MFYEITNHIGEITTPVTRAALQKAFKILDNLKYQALEDEIEQVYQGMEVEQVNMQEFIHLVDKHITAVCDLVGVTFVESAQFHFIVERLYLIMFLRNVTELVENESEEEWLANVLAERMGTAPHREIEYIESADKLYNNILKLAEFIHDDNVPDNSSFISMLTTMVAIIGDRKIPEQFKDIRNVNEVEFESIVKLIPYDKLDNTDVAISLLFGTIVDVDYRDYSLEERKDLLDDVVLDDDRTIEIRTIYIDLLTKFHGLRV